MRRIIPVGLVLLVALLAWWLTRDRSAAQPYEVSLRPSRAWVLPLGRVQLAADVTSTASVQGLRYQWTSDQGVVFGRKPGEATWVAPSDVGTYTVSVWARDGAGQRRTASVRLEVRSPEARQVADAPGYALAVELDAPSICRNEDVAIRVDASDATGDSAWLTANVQFGDHMVLTGVPGSSVIARLVSDESKPGATPIQVNLFDARTRENVASRTIPYQVRDCTSATGGLRVICSPADQTRCRVEADGLAAVRYRWDFGDGTPESTTTAGYQEHRYESGVEAGFASGYTVTVHAADAAGRELRARTSILLTNHHWALAQKFGRLHLKVSFDQSRQDADGFYSDIRIHNPFDEAIEVDSIEIDDIPCRSAESPPVAEDWHPVGVSSVLAGKTRFAAGELYVLRWRPQVADDICDCQALVRGVGAETGRPAQGRWHMYTKDVGIRATAELASHLQDALAILSQERGRPVATITPQELANLEARGLLPPLTQEPAQP